METAAMVALGALLSTFGAAATPAASASQRIESECASEIGLLCGGRQDILRCLEEYKGSLTPSCHAARLGKPAGPVQRSPGRNTSRSASSPVASPHVSLHQVKIPESYSGPGEKAFPALHAALVAELPGALGVISQNLGQPGFVSGFAHPLSITVVHEPTSPLAWVRTQDDDTSDFAQFLEINLAWWEDCRSQAELRAVLTHELTHAVLRDFVHINPDDSLIPQWFDEGTATLFGGEPAFSDKLNYAAYRFGAAHAENPFCALRNADWEGLPRGDCYPYWALAVRHIVEAHPGALPKIVARMRGGEPLELALQWETGLTWETFQEHVKQYTRQTFDGLTLWHRLRGRWWALLRCK